MPAHDHVLHLQRVHRVLEHRQAVQVRVDDDVGHVAVNEELAWQEPDDLVGWHAAVRAPDPEVVRHLLRDEAREEVGCLGEPLRGPPPVVLEQVLQRVHEPT
jgi:hypothetical protein